MPAAAAATWEANPLLPPPVTASTREALDSATPHEEPGTIEPPATAPSIEALTVTEPTASVLPPELKALAEAIPRRELPPPEVVHQPVPILAPEVDLFAIVGSQATFDVLVSPDGQVEAVNLIESTHPDIVAPAMTALLARRYAPTTEPRPSIWLRETVEF